MKPIPFAIPIITLAICATILGSQHIAIRALKQKQNLLLAEIATARKSPTLANASSISKSEKNRPDEWKKMMADLADVIGRDPTLELDDMRHLDILILEMDEAELVAALEQVGVLSLAASSRQEIQRMLLDALTKKNPEFVCKRFLEEANVPSSPFTWAVKQAFEAWLKIDSPAAHSWLDQQLAEGTLDGKSLDGENAIRLSMQAASLYSLIASDPTAASRRMNDIPPEQRKELLLGSHYSVAEKDHKAFADVVRNTLPKEDHSKVLSSQVELHGNQGDLTKMSDYLTRIHATKEESIACAETLALTHFRLQSRERKVTRGDFDQFYQWAGSIAPDSADRVTGTALAASLFSGGNASFDELAAIASEYHRAGAGDEILIPLLQQSRVIDGASKAKARELAKEITNPQLREEILNQLP
jgi:hypothetical protein